MVLSCASSRLRTLMLSICHRNFLFYYDARGCMLPRPYLSHVRVITVVENFPLPLRYCKPQRPPASGAPADFMQKGGGQGLKPRWPPWQTYWIFNELFFATQLNHFFFFFFFGKGHKEKLSCVWQIFWKFANIAEDLMKKTQNICQGGQLGLRPEQPPCVPSWIRSH